MMRIEKIKKEDKKGGNVVVEDRYRGMRYRGMRY